MGRRSEPRIVILIPVIVRGTDASGDPSEFVAETCDISVSGARLRGVSAIAVPGKKIEIECKGKKASYRTQWVGQPRSLSANQAGLQLLEPGKYIWGVPSKEWAADTFDTSQLTNGAPIPVPVGFVGAPPKRRNGEDRRRFPRALYRVETQVQSEESQKGQPGTITDISLGGCYVEMLGPLPVDTVVGLDLKSGTTALHLFGTIRSSQPGFGMGVEFLKMSAADFEKLHSFVPEPPTADELTQEPAQDVIPRSENGASPVEILPSTATNGHYATTAETLGVVMRLLFKKGLVTRAEVAEEIESLKTAKVDSLP